MMLALALQDPATLVERLGENAIEAREEAEAELRRMGERAVPALEAGLAHPDAEVRARALHLLAARLDRLAPSLIGRHAALREAKLARDVSTHFAKIAAGRAPFGAADRGKLVALAPEWASLRALGAEAVPVLLRELQGPGRVHAVLALGLFDDLRAAAALEAIAGTGERVLVEVGG